MPACLFKPFLTPGFQVNALSFCIIVVQSHPGEDKVKFRVVYQDGGIEGYNLL
jgi:hypothetical protein